MPDLIDRTELMTRIFDACLSFTVSDDPKERKASIQTRDAILSVIEAAPNILEIEKEKISKNLSIDKNTMDFLIMVQKAFKARSDSP